MLLSSLACSCDIGGNSRASISFPNWSKLQLVSVLQARSVAMMQITMLVFNLNQRTIDHMIRGKILSTRP